MTTPNIETYHIKKSSVRKDVEYIFVMHDMGSFNLTNRTGAVDHFDMVFCIGSIRKKRLRRLKQPRIFLGRQRLRSDICFEYAYTTKRPVIFIDTPMKVINPEYQLIDTIPIKIMLRNEIGRSIGMDEAGKTVEVAREMIEHAIEYRDRIGVFT